MKREQLRKIAADLEQRVGERTQELRDSQLRLRDLATELTLIEQRERRRLAGELHDYLAQLLVLIRIKVRQTSAYVKEAAPTALLMEADQAIINSLNYTRSLVAELAPPALQEFGLLEGFGWLADQMQNHGLTVTVKKNIQQIVLDDDQAVLVFQSTRELLFNVLKHAGTKQAEVTIDRNSDGHLVVTVRDEGCGFNLDEMLTQDGQRKRFGLFSVRERTEAMGGRLEVTTGADQGTCAALIVPYWPAAARTEVKSGPASSSASMPMTEPETSGSAPSGGGLFSTPSDAAQGRVLRILLADDHAMVRQGLRSILEAYRDISVVGEASDGEEAVGMAELLTPDVIVMDVNMPKMDGIEATRRVKARWPAITVVGLSVSPPAQVESRLLEAGASCYVSKEAVGDQLYDAIVAGVKRGAALCSAENRAVRSQGEC
jgi:CheY-like chemotaxis protein